MAIDGVKIRRGLHTMLTQAEIDLDMWLAMRDLRQMDNVILLLNRRYGRFYMAAENALFNSMITILYAVFERRHDTINFWLLRNSLLAAASQSQMSELEDTYASIKFTWKKIAVIRNEVVGHQSMDRTSAESHDIAGLTVDHARQMIISCQELLFRIARDFHDTHILFNIKSTDAFDNLMADLLAVNGRSCT